MLGAQLARTKRINDVESVEVTSKQGLFGDEHRRHADAVAMVQRTPVRAKSHAGAQTVLTDDGTTDAAARRRQPQAAVGIVKLIGLLAVGGRYGGLAPCPQPQGLRTAQVSAKQ